MAARQAKRVERSTMGKVSNSSSETLTLISKRVWQGNYRTEFPDTIEDGEEGEFLHEATNDKDSVAGIVYKLHDGTRWVIAWSNPRCGMNKVYTNIHKQPIQWDQIKTNLDNKGNQKYSVKKHGYVASMEIDYYSNTPSLKASFELED